MKNGKMETDPDVNKWVAHFIALRNRIKEIDAVRSEVEELKNEVGGRILDFLDRTNQEAARTRAGTATASVRHSASLADPDTFMEYVIGHGAFELMDRRANATACREFADANGGLPPGVKLNSVRIINVRTAGEK